MGNLGFTGPSSLLYHLHRPTAVLRVDYLGQTTWASDPDPRLRHRHLRTSSLPVEGNWIEDRVPLLFNEAVAISHTRPPATHRRFYRHAAGHADPSACHGQGPRGSAPAAPPFPGRHPLPAPPRAVHPIRLHP